MAAEKEVMIEEFKMVDKVTSFYSCQNKTCNKRMPSVQHGSGFFKCEVCRMSQKLKYAKKALSARICVEIDGNDLWLSAFTDVMITLMSKAGIEEDATVDEITNAMMCMEDILIRYNAKSNCILKAF